MNLLLLTFSINNYNKYKNLDIIKQKSFITIYSKDRIKKVILTINKINDILKKNLILIFSIQN